jgi:hypothetical protein
MTVTLETKDRKTLILKENRCYSTYEEKDNGEIVNILNLSLYFSTYQMASIIRKGVSLKDFCRETKVVHLKVGEKVKSFIVGDLIDIDYKENTVRWEIE